MSKPEGVEPMPVVYVVGQKVGGLWVPVSVHQTEKGAQWASRRYAERFAHEDFEFKVAGFILEE